MNGSCCYVNQDGERFIDESAPSDIDRCKVIEQQGGAYSIIGTGLLEECQNGKMAHMKGIVGEDRANEAWDASDDLALCDSSDEAFKADTIEGLAELIGVPAGRRFNESRYHAMHEKFAPLAREALPWHSNAMRNGGMPWMVTK